MPWEQIVVMPAFWYAMAIIGSTALVCATVAAIVGFGVSVWIGRGIVKLLAGEIGHKYREYRKRRNFRLNLRTEAH